MMRTKPRPPTLLPHKKHFYIDSKYIDSDTGIAKYLCSVFIDSSETRVRTNENNRQGRVILPEHTTFIDHQSADIPVVGNKL